MVEKAIQIIANVFALGGGGGVFRPSRTKTALSVHPIITNLAVFNGIHSIT